MLWRWWIHEWFQVILKVLTRTLLISKTWSPSSPEVMRRNQCSGPDLVEVIGVEPPDGGCIILWLAFPEKNGVRWSWKKLCGHFDKIGCDNIMWLALSSFIISRKKGVGQSRNLFWQDRCWYHTVLGFECLHYVWRKMNLTNLKEVLWKCRQNCSLPHARQSAARAPEQW